MEFRKRNNLRHPYCIYLTEEEAEKFASGNGSQRIAWEMRMKLLRHFEKEFKDGVPPVSHWTSFGALWV